MDKPTGYTHEALEEMRKPKDEGGLGEFFDAQMRNDPLPLERADINVDLINQYEEGEHPELGPVLLFGIETTGGGLPIYNGFSDWLEEMHYESLPVIEITNPKKVGTEKRDRIVAALQPLIECGKLYAPSWMIGDKSAKEGLGYELRRLGKASHDDIADALHNIPTHLSKKNLPLRAEDPCDLYISVDLAWSEKKRSDWTVLMAVAVDSKGCHWIIDYDRFQISSPTGIYSRMLAFYRKFNGDKSIRKMSSRKYPGAWR
jgi:hypothetical protein